VNRELDDILDEVRAQIARGGEPDVAAVEARVRAVDPSALPHVRRLLAVHRAKRSLAAPSRARPQPTAPERRREVYRAKPTVSANMSVRARAAAGYTVALEWDAAKGVTRWEVRVGERPDARSPYTDRETASLDVPRVELPLSDLPQRVSIVGRNTAGRIVQRALVSGLTRANWNQKWQQRPSAS
jgi:hypothetical protein